MLPTVGRIVIYKLGPGDDEANSNFAEELPAVIVRVWNPTEDGAVNLKILNDGPEDLWKTSVVRGDNPGEWNWPKRVDE